MLVRLCQVRLPGAKKFRGVKEKASKVIFSLLRKQKVVLSR